MLDVRSIKGRTVRRDRKDSREKPAYAGKNEHTTLTMHVQKMGVSTQSTQHEGSIIKCIYIVYVSYIYRVCIVYVS